MFKKRGARVQGWIFPNTCHLKLVSVIFLKKKMVSVAVIKPKIPGQDHLAVCTWVLNSATSIILRARTGVGGPRQRSMNPELSEAGSSERVLFLVLGENEVPLVSSPQISGLRIVTEFAMLFWRCSTWCNLLHTHETNIEQKVLVNMAGKCYSCSIGLEVEPGEWMWV